MLTHNHQAALLLRPPSRLPCWAARCLVCVTFPMIWVGGLVTTYHAGMAVPDWPGTYGYNLFLYSWNTWLAGPFDLLIEHGHRLWGTVVGMLSIVLVILVLRYERRRWIKWLSVAALAAVFVQGALGGMRVLADDRQLALIHGCFGPAFFALTVALATFLSADWQTRPLVELAGASRISRIALATAVLAYLQLCVGAVLRHMPLWFGPGQFRAMAIVHVALALLLAGHVVLLFYRVLRHASRETRLVVPASMLLAGVIAQIVLGIGTWLAKYGLPPVLIERGWETSYVVSAEGRLPASLATAHVAMGSLFVATAVAITLKAVRYYREAAPGTIGQRTIVQQRILESPAVCATGSASVGTPPLALIGTPSLALIKGGLSA